MEKFTVEGSIGALQTENERLRMENTYLKKLNAVVHTRQDKAKIQVVYELRQN
ncbi:hypothetical protein [Bacillus sp. AFS019443]|uniref:hypothetical protein n=1 Tax=Bacillus sp. AFS019443 TaxID=2034279 RepID=UPI001481ECDE|nr:hypothetical protein [Bacillus sp. AFS019443]